MISKPYTALLLLMSPQSSILLGCCSSALHFYTLVLIAAVGSQGSQAWVLLAVGAACLVSSLEGDRQGSLGEAYLGASAQQPHSC